MFGFNMDLPISKSENIQWRLIEEKAVLLHIDEGILLQLDDTGTKIWLMVDGKKSGAEIADRIAQNFEVKKKTAEKDVSELLKQLLKDEAILLNRRKG